MACNDLGGKVRRREWLITEVDTWTRGAVYHLLSMDVVVVVVRAKPSKKERKEEMNLKDITLPLFCCSFPPFFVVLANSARLAVKQTS